MQELTPEESNCLTICAKKLATFQVKSAELLAKENKRIIAEKTKAMQGGR